MRGARWVTLLALTCAAAPTWASAQAAMPSDTALRRAQRLVAEGQGAAGRALVDTVLAQAATQPARQAEGLFWRAALAEQASSAERDYQRVTVEHALSPWSGEALLRLGQLAYARGERLAALKSFERIVVEQAETPIAATGHFWKGRVLLEQGDVAPACESLREAARRSAPQAIELRNQVEFYAQRCRETPSAPATAAAPVMAPPASAPVVSANAQTASVLPPVGTAAGASTGMVERTASRVPSWSLQVSAHTTRADAAKAARTLGNRGYQARVEGTSAPFRVRVGRYASEAEATRDLVRARKKGLKGARVVRAEAP